MRSSARLKKDSQLWGLDAPASVAVSKTAPGPEGQEEVTTSFISIPNPLKPSSARVVRADGSKVKVAQGELPGAKAERIEVGTVEPGPGGARPQGDGRLVVW